MSSHDRFAPASPGLSRNAVIAGSVVLLHVAGLWALQSGLLRKAAEIVVPAEVLAEFLKPPAPEVAKPAPAPPPPPKPQPRQPVVHKTPMPVAKPDSTPAPNAPAAVPEPAPVVQAPPAPSAPPAAPAPPAPPRIELPSSNAAYLNNKINYPAISRRLGEQGKVVLRVLIDAQGMPQKLEIKQSSGYERLDQAAVTTVERWRFVPGKRNGVPEAMWNIVPINFVLE